jgi:hypothetical protein
VSDTAAKGGTLVHLVSYKPGAKAPRDHGVVGVSNPDFTTFTDKSGKPKPWHHGMPKRNGKLSPSTPMGICATASGSVYVLTIGPLTLIEYTKEQLK